MTLMLKSSTSVPWKDALPDDATPTVVHFGRDDQGVGAVQVAVADVVARPTKGALTAMWKTRGQNTAMPVVVAAVSGDGVWLHGPDEKEDPVGPVSVSQAERFLQSVLDEPHGIAAHTQLRAIRTHLGTVGGAGYANHYLFATYYLRKEVPVRKDWAGSRDRAAAMLTKRGKELIEALGFETEPAAGGTLVLRGQSKSRRAIAVLLDETENFDQKSAKYQLSPVAHGLEVAGREDVPWVIVMRKDTLRLYPGRDGVGVGQRGQSETYFELDLAFVDQEFAGLLPLIFSADALEKDGSADEILKGSGKYAADLGSRLRDRVYEGVVPGLATAIAQRLPSLGRAVDAEGLNTAYALTMRILFRLLFQAYGESTELLPVDNENYRANSLTRFVASTDESKGFDESASSIWRDLLQVWDAISNGNKQWGIPPYGGSLFDQTSPEGELIEKIKLPDSVIGPALRAMLTERTEDGVLGAVDFRSLQVREFGTIYEGLLESSLSLAEGDLTLDKNGAFVPANEGDKVEAHAGEAYFHSASGERKATGSYYTPKIVVDHLIERSIVPAIQAHLAKVKELMDAGREREATDAFFDFRVADLAMGSAHFLVAAVDKIERYMRDFLTTSPVPGVRAELARLADSARRALAEVSEADVEINEAQLLRRQVARRCVYGLDINPLAVELSQLAIWIHTFVPGLPMASLEHNLVRANSLTGIGTIDEAIDALGVGDLLAPLIREPLSAARALMNDYANASEADKAEVARGAETLSNARAAAAPAKMIFDVGVAMRLGAVPPGSAFTQTDLEELAADPRVEGAIAPLSPAHMPLLFPEVFLREAGGFDVLLGNPPWESAYLTEDRWWNLRAPGVLTLHDHQKEERIQQLRDDRPDLRAAFEREVSVQERTRAALLKRGWPGLGSGHVDLYQAFAWRNWELLRERGRLGIVLPRSAHSGSALALWRKEVLERGTFSSVVMIENAARWAFDMEARYTIGLTVVHRTPGDDVRFAGPFASEAAFRLGENNLAAVPVDEFKRWTDAAAFLVIPDQEGVETFRVLKRHPKFGSGGPRWKLRPSRGDLLAWKELPSAPVNGVPLRAGRSFNLWDPDAAPPRTELDAGAFRSAYLKYLTAASRNRRSAHYGATYDLGALPIDRARIATRWISRATDSRTCIAVLLPPGVATDDSASVMHRLAGGARAEAFLLGMLCSIPFDWQARLLTEMNFTFEVLNALAIPEFHDGLLADRVVQVSGSLAAADGRYREWANEVGVEVGSAKDEAVKTDLIAELDALASLLYGLTTDQVEHVFATFHRGWDYRSRLDAVLAHYDRWKDAA